MYAWASEVPIGSADGLLGVVILLAPARRLVAARPVLLDVAELALDLVDLFGVAHVLANVVADLDGRVAGSRAKLDDNVERL